MSVSISLIGGEPVEKARRPELSEFETHQHILDRVASFESDALLDPPPDELVAVLTIDDGIAILDEPADVPLIGDRCFRYRRQGPMHICQRSGAGKGCHVSWSYTCAGALTDHEAIALVGWTLGRASERKEDRGTDSD